MESEKAKHRLIAIAVLGVLCVGGAVGVRQFYRKPIYGNWLGYMYYDVDGKLEKDADGGQFILVLHDNGAYAENGNETSGTFTHKGDQLKLSPVKFRGKTPEELRVQYHDKEGKMNSTMRKLLERVMKPMLLQYERSKDQMIFLEDGNSYIFDRMN